MYPMLQIRPRSSHDLVGIGLLVQGDKRRDLLAPIRKHVDALIA